MKFNMDLVRLSNLVMAHAGNIAKKDYQCPVLSKFASGSKKLPEIFADPGFDKVNRFISSVSGVNIAFDKFRIGPKQKYLNFEGVVNATGPNMVDAAPQFISIIREFDRSVARKIMENEALQVAAAPVDVHLGEWKLNAMLTQTDFIAATPQYDVRSILSKERKNDHTFLELMLSQKFFVEISNYILRGEGNYYQLFNESGWKQYVKDVQEVYEDTVYRMSLGTNDEGIVGTNEVVF